MTVDLVQAGSQVTASALTYCELVSQCFSSGDVVDTRAQRGLGFQDRFTQNHGLEHFFAGALHQSFRVVQLDFQYLTGFVQDLSTFQNVIGFEERLGSGVENYVRG
ncbi:hypothetical protein D3C81_1852540 [compost metagenome]